MSHTVFSERNSAQAHAEDGARPQSSCKRRRLWHRVRREQVLVRGKVGSCQYPCRKLRRSFETTLRHDDLLKLPRQSLCRPNEIGWRQYSAA